MSDVISFDDARTRTKKKSENLLYAAIRYLADGLGQEHVREEDREDFEKAAARLRTGRELSQAEERAAWRRLKKYADALDAAGIQFDRIPEPSWPCEAVRLIEIVEDNALLFHTPERVAYALLSRDEHLETHRVRGREFRLWLQSRFRAEVGKTPASQALHDALINIEATCIFSRAEEQVYVRLAERSDKIYIDLASASWEAVEVSADAWQIVATAPVNFRRARGLAPLPRPERGGGIDELRKFVNVPDDDDWRLLVGWLVAALRPRGPYPVLVLTAEQGAGKTTLVRVLRALVDPATAAVRTSPRDERDLMIAATNSWILAFDNLSSIAAWLSDGLSRIATGGGFATRELYSDSDEVIFDAMRPITLNGIDDVVSRHDLLDRALLLSLPPIPDERRRPEEEFWREFDKARPRVLGALLDAVAVGLRNIENVKLERLPRMADFAKWVTACEPALPWAPGGFMEAYTGNRAQAVDLALESDLVASAIRELLASRDAWTGTATELLEALEQYTSERQRKSRAWPKSARGLAGRVRRAATFLRTIGVEVEFATAGRDRDKHRAIVLEKVRKLPSPPSPPSPEPGKPHGSSLFAGTQTGTQNKAGTQTRSVPSPLEAARGAIGDDGDGGDDDLHSLSIDPCRSGEFL